MLKTFPVLAILLISKISKISGNDVLPPDSAHVIDVTFTSVEIKWSYNDPANAPGESIYLIQYKRDDFEEDFTNITVNNVQSYNIEGLFLMTEYVIQILAFKENDQNGVLLWSSPSQRIVIYTATVRLALLRAIQNGDLNIVKDLLDLDPDIDEGDGMYLKMASQMGHLEVVKYLLQEGADPDADEDGEAVQEAAKNNHYEVVNALLIAEADANVGDGMHYAAQNGNEKIVRLLHKFGADVNKPLPEEPWIHPETKEHYGYGWTPLHVAARWGTTSIVRVLYDLGADLSARDPNGDTPLHIAVKFPQIWLVRELLKFCPDLSLENNDGKTVVDLVEDLPHAIYASLTSRDGMMLRYIIANITLEKIRSNSNTEEAATDLEEEIEFLAENNSTIGDLVEAVGKTDSHVDFILQELFEDTIYLEIEDAFADHHCNGDGLGKWEAEFNMDYKAHCVCEPGNGPVLKLEPLDREKLCE